MARGRLSASLGTVWVIVFGVDRTEQSGRVCEIAERGCGDGLHAGLERWMDGGREPWVVVGRDVVGDAAGLLGLAVGVRIGAADVPEDRRDVPFAAEGSEVLAGGYRRS